MEDFPKLVLFLYIPLEYIPLLRVEGTAGRGISAGRIAVRQQVHAADGLLLNGKAHRGARVGAVCREWAPLGSDVVMISHQHISPVGKPLWQHPRISPCYAQHNGH